MGIQEACEALATSCCLELSYNGLLRCVEVHAVGYTADEKPVAVVWQKTGTTVEGWQVIRLERAKHFRISGESSKAPRRGYEKSKFPLHRIECSV